MAYPGYDRAGALGDLRTADYGRLDEQQHVYLVYTGRGLYPQAQLRRQMDLLAPSIFGTRTSRARRRWR